LTTVLIPGFMLDQDLWSDIGPFLQTRAPLVHADLASADSIEEMAQHTIGMIPAGPFDVIGFSMGGYVAREIARLAPDRVRQLVLIATSSRGDSELQARRKVDAAMAAPKTFAGVNRRSIRQSLAPQREQDEQLVNRIHAMSMRLGGDTFRRQALLRREGDTDRLSEIRCPTLILAGEQDRLRGLDESMELHQGIRGSELKTINAGHMLPMEAPTETQAMLAQFLQHNPA